jgi:hypothetical protein
MFLPKVPRLRVAFAINNNLNMKLRDSNVVQLSAIVQLWYHAQWVLEVDATEVPVEEARNPRAETEGRNRGPK